MYQLHIILFCDNYSKICSITTTGNYFMWQLQEFLLIYYINPVLWQQQEVLLCNNYRSSALWLLRVLKFLFCDNTDNYRRFWHRLISDNYRIFFVWQLQKMCPVATSRISVLCQPELPLFWQKLKSKLVFSVEISEVGCIGRGTYCSETFYHVRYRHVRFRVMGSYVAVPYTHYTVRNFFYLAQVTTLNIF
jgi:hypothetical protein